MNFVDQEIVPGHPALHAYCRRVGAVEKNFRRYVIEESDASAYLGGKKIVATITVSSDGAIKVDDSAFAPTADEARTIKEEVAKSPFPRSINARKTSRPPQLDGVDAKDFCVFYDSSGEEIVFIQWRKDGQKPDLPLTFWSDGVWRMMEPYEKLPLFGQEQLNAAATIFLHEGAKAARDVKRMIADGGDALAAHPWGDDLRHAAHIGWAGGAENANRVDWGPLKKLSPHVKLILVADHDQVGVDAATKISSILRRPMAAIFFDDRFPQGFDLADPWPMRPAWWRRRRYVGPTLDDLTVPATWATEVAHTKDKGRPTFKIRKQFSAEWLWCEEPVVFIHRLQTNRLRTEAVFNHSVRPFSDSEDTARLLARQVWSRCDGVAYRPCLASDRFAVVINVDGLRLVNTFRPTAIKPIKGDVRPFIKFLFNLFPNKADRRETMRWIATLIARPDVRMRYSLLLVSETQGVGKGTLGEAILAPLVGLWNTSFPSEKTVVEAGFNSWIARKRLAVVHEIYAGQSRKGYDRLKSVITDAIIEVNEKYLTSYKVENFLHIVACSNSMRAIHLDDSDRRWLVPRVTEQQQPVKYWTDFHEWLRGEGLGIIFLWAENYVTKPGVVVESGAHAPSTTAKEEIVAESRSEGQRLAYDLGEIVKQSNQKIVIAVEDVREWVARKRGLDKGDHRLEKSLTLRVALKAAGLKEPRRRIGQRQQRFTITKKTGNNYGVHSPGIKTVAFFSHIVANFEIDQGTEWPGLKEFYRDPDDVWPM